MNNLLITQFKLLVQHIKNTLKDDSVNTFRLKQVQNALKIIENYPKKIKKGNDLKDVAGIGKGTIDRIDEILTSGTLSEITTIDINTIKIVDELTKVINIGDKIAVKLVTEYKIKSVADLIKKYEKGKVPLNDKIALGLKYYKILEENIPRVEITKIGKIVSEAVTEINPNLITIICGSYRRGKSHSNDIDILIIEPDQSVVKNVIKQLIKKLSKPLDKNDKYPLVIDNLTNTGTTKYMGFCQYKGRKVRRIDIRAIPYKSYATSLLYFTGPSTLNQKMRMVAKKKGYLLNEYGLYKININGKKRVPVESEKDIFDILDLVYLEPKDRTK